jgi:polysaccharide export outer membrane protein
MNIKRLLLIVFGSLYYILTLNSCADSKKLSYFNNIPNDTTTSIQLRNIETVIQKNDILQIVITSLDEATTRILNGMSVASTTGSTLLNGSVSGYLVNEDGTVTLPLLGVIKAEGLTKSQLSAKIVSDLGLKKLAIDPVVSVRILNYKITVLGEVLKPGVIPVPNEKITLPEALGMAGDLTPYGRRDNVLLIREIDGKRTYKRFSLNNSQSFDRDFYYLQNQDIIYVEPNKAKAGLSDRATQLVPIIISSLSLIAVILSQVLRN